MSALGRHRLTAWSRRHALCVLGACGAAALTGASWPLAAVAVWSFAGLFRAGRGTFTPSGKFGAANWATTLRLALVVTLGLGAYGREGTVLASLALLVFFLDGLDGLLARRLGEASDFGAHYDMETDALFVLVLELQLWFGGSLGPWILTTGLLRYIYVLAVALRPQASEMPRWWVARYAFAVLVIGLVLAMMLPGPLGAGAAVVGTVAVSASFVRSAVWSFVGGPAVAETRRIS